MQRCGANRASAPVWTCGRLDVDVCFMRCLSCNYDLSNLTEHRCPECGRAFDPTIRTTYGPRPRAVFSVWGLFIKGGLVVWALTFGVYLIAMLGSGFRDWDAILPYVLSIACAATGTLWGLGLIIVVLDFIIRVIRGDIDQS